MPGLSLVLVASMLAYPSLPATNLPAALPTADELIQDLERNQARLQNLLEQYVCQEQGITLYLDGHGAVTRKDIQLFEDTWVHGHLLKMLLQQDGKPLSEAEVRKEQARVSALVKRFSKAPEGQDSLTSVTPLDILRAVQITTLRRELVQEKPAWVVEFVPKADFQAHTHLEAQVSKLAGTMVVDEASRQILRMDAHLVKPLRIFAGLAASFAPGSSFSFEQAPVDGDVWLPIHARIHFAGRLLLFKKIAIDADVHYHDFQRATVEVHPGSAAQVPESPTR